MLVGGCARDNKNDVSDSDNDASVDIVLAEETSTGDKTPSQTLSPPPPDVAKNTEGRDHQQQTIAAEAKAKRVPASYLEAAGAIDLRNFPRPDDAANVNASALKLEYETGATGAAAVEFCKSNLSSAGWKHDTELDMSAGGDRFLYFEKQDFICKLMALSGERTRVTIENRGNIDARELPRMADAEFKFQDATSVYYSTKNSAEETVRYLRSELEKDGWVQYVEQEQEWDSESTQGAFRFLARGTHVYLYVRGNDQGCEVTIAASMEGVQFPIAPNVTKIVWSKRPFRIQFHTTGELDGVADLIQRHAKEHGWARMPEHDVRFSDRMRMVFKRDEQSRLVFTVTPYDEGVLGFVGLDVSETDLQRLLEDHPLLAESESQRGEHDAGPMAEPNVDGEDESPIPGDVSEPKKQIESSGPQIAMEEFPVPEKVTDLDRLALLPAITYDSLSTPATQIEYYRGELKERGWTEKKDDTVVDDILTTVVFRKRALSIEISIVRQDDDKTYRTFIKGDGIGWPESDDAEFEE